MGKSVYLCDGTKCCFHRRGDERETEMGEQEPLRDPKNGKRLSVEVNVSSQFSVSGRDKGLLSNGATMQAHDMRNTGGEDTLQSTDSNQASISMQPSAMAVIALLFYIL